MHLTRWNYILSYWNSQAVIFFFGSLYDLLSFPPQWEWMSTGSKPKKCYLKSVKRAPKKEFTLISNWIVTPKGNLSGGFFFLSPGVNVCLCPGKFKYSLSHCGVRVGLGSELEAQSGSSALLVVHSRSLSWAGYLPLIPYSGRMEVSWLKARNEKVWYI